MQGIPHDYFVSNSIFSFLLSQQHTKWWRRGQIISSTIPSAECNRNFLRPRKHNVPSCSSAPPELGTAPNFLPSTKPAPPSRPPTTPPSTSHPLPPLRQSHIPGKFSRLCWHQNRAIPFKMDIGEIFPLIGPTMKLRTAYYENLAKYVPIQFSTSTHSTLCSRLRETHVT